MIQTLDDSVEWDTFHETTPPVSARETYRISLIFLLFSTPNITRSRSFKQPFRSTEYVHVYVCVSVWACAKQKSDYFTNQLSPFLPFNNEQFKHRNRTFDTFASHICTLTHTSTYKSACFFVVPLSIKKN